MNARIGSMADVIAFRSDVRQALARGSLNPVAREEILLALTELGTNLVLHSEGGELGFEATGGNGAPVRIRSCNRVPQELLSPGESPAGQYRGLGLGLSSLHRLMDRVETRLDGDCFVVICEKGLAMGRRART